MACFIFEIFESLVGNRRQYMVFNVVVGGLGILMNAVTLLVKFRLSTEELKALRKENKVSIIGVLSKSILGKDTLLKKSTFALITPEQDKEKQNDKYLLSDTVRELNINLTKSNERRSSQAID
ncbi:MAG: hypothetical protein ACMG6E_07710 [Candidatus Roizmanbacteria bacterium]